MFVGVVADGVYIIVIDGLGYFVIYHCVGACEKSVFVGVRVNMGRFWEEFFGLVVEERKLLIMKVILVDFLTI